MMVFKSTWLVNKRYDLIFFHFSALIGFISLLALYVFGPQSSFFIYIAQSALAGGPHLYLTMTPLLSSKVRQNLVKWPLYLILFLSTISAILVIYYKGQFISNFIISATFYLACWHAYRQHYGILKIYDYVHAKKENDPDIRTDLAPLYLFFGLVYNMLIFYGFTFPNLPYTISRSWTIQMIYPRIGMELFMIYVLITSFVGLYAFYKIFKNRILQDKPLPLPQIILVTVNVAASLVLYLLIPEQKAYMFMWLIPTLGHNIQYFGFVWMFEKQRAEYLQEKNEDFGGPLVLVKNNKWVVYFLIPYSVAILTIAAGLSGYILTAIFCTYFITIFHYLYDGVIWKKNFNLHVRPVSERFGRVIN